MSRPIFISFSSKDLATAERVRGEIEGHGFATWMSSRDIRPGESFQEAIVHALRGAGAVVLVFSENANKSSEIVKEVALASTHGIPLIPARVEDIAPSAALSYEFITRQWIDLFRDWDGAMARLCAHLKHVTLGRLDDQAGGTEGSFSAELSLAEIPHNLPEQATSFIGREEEQARLKDLLGKHRLVTLLGSGGLGKTRLSLQVAETVIRNYPDGVWFVELAALSEPQLVAETIAGIFSLVVPAERSAKDVLLGFLKQKKLLLILDNCEHLIAATATLAQALIRGCPQVSIMASSREPLQINDEHTFRMPVLASPPADESTSAEHAQTFPAVQLFVARAKQSLGHYELTDADAPAVAAICRRLDGIALAIELAAPRLKMLKPDQLLSKLDERFKILTGGSRTALPRQQTLRALIDWSYNLLSPSEQALMRRLSVFAGSWTMESAGAVASGELVEEWEVFDLLASLVDKSLVHSEHGEVTTRYSFLESTRHYAADKLKEAGETGYRDRMAEHLAQMMKEAETAYETTPTMAWRAQYGPEIGNLRAALDWAFGPTGDQQVGIAALAYSSWLWSELDLTAEERRRLDATMSYVSEDTPSATSARIHYMRTAVRSLGSASARDDARKAVQLARRSTDRLALGRALVHQARTLLSPATLAEARSLLEEALSSARVAGRSKLLGVTLICLGVVEYLEGSLSAARSRYEESLNIARALHDVQLINSVLQNVAEILFASGDVAGAIVAGREALEAARTASDRLAEYLICTNLAAYYLLSGDTEEGARSAVLGLKQSRSMEDEFIATVNIQHLALVCARYSAIPEAVKLQGYVDAVYLREGTSREPTERAISDLVVTAIEGKLDNVERDRLLSQGAALTIDEASEIALKNVYENAA